MNGQNFALRPFTSFASFAINGTIARHHSCLTITYNLTGPLEDLIIAPRAAKPARHWVLWERTCFEFFLARQNAASYWEGNLSPAGHWNVFHLSDYRHGIQEEPAFQELPFSVQQKPERLMLSLNVDLTDIVPRDQPLEVGISAILQPRDGRLSFWALTHQGPEPDFHNRRGFVIKI